MVYNNSQLIKVIDLSETKTGNLAAAAEEQVTIQPPVGFAYKIIHTGFYTGIPAGGASGSHYVLLSMNNLASKQRLQYFKYASVFGSELSVMGSGIAITADSSQNPSDEQAQATVIKDIWATNEEPLYFNYKNITDVAQDKDREYNIRVLVYRGVE